MLHNSFIIRNARLLTLEGPAGPRRGAAMSDLGVRTMSDLLVQRGSIAGIQSSLTSTFCRDHPSLPAFDVGDRVVMPAFIDCHTHACFAGSRLDEWDLKRKGVSYQEILASGGGIMSTVKATRSASSSHLQEALLARLAAAAEFGTGTIEVKSGYGLSQEAELAMLDCIAATARRSPISVVATALLGHAIDSSIPDFVESTINLTLPAIAAKYPGIPIDAFVENNAWSVDQACRLFEAARLRNLPVRVHTDQFTSLGMIGEALQLNARSCDHLEAATESDLRLLATSDTVAVGLPGCGFHLDGRYANLRFAIDHGGAVAIATNFNPGSSPCLSMPMMIALAVRHCGLSPQEAITASTVNAAHVLAMHGRGTLTVGSRADILVLNTTDERSVAYEFGMNPVERLFIAGVEQPRGHSLAI